MIHNKIKAPIEDFKTGIQIPDSVNALIEFPIDVPQILKRLGQHKMGQIKAMKLNIAKFGTSGRVCLEKNNSKLD